MKVGNCRRAAGRYFHVNLSRAKNAPEPDEQPEEVWSVRKGTYDGKPIIVRLNDTFAGAASAKFSFRCGFAVLLKSPDANGFPTPEESTALGGYEDEFVTTFCADGDGWLVAVISTNRLSPIRPWFTPPS